jgi:hypothetical protein
MALRAGMCCLGPSKGRKRTLSLVASTAGAGAPHSSGPDSLKFALAGRPTDEKRKSLRNLGNSDSVANWRQSEKFLLSRAKFLARLRRQAGGGKRSLHVYPPVLLAAQDSAFSLYLEESLGQG